MLFTSGTCPIIGNAGGGSYECFAGSNTVSRCAADSAIQSASVSGRISGHYGGNTRVAALASPRPQSAAARHGAGPVLDGVLAACLALCVRHLSALRLSGHRAFAGSDAGTVDKSSLRMG